MWSWKQNWLFMDRRLILDHSGASVRILAAYCRQTILDLDRRESRLTLNSPLYIAIARTPLDTRNRTQPNTFPELRVLVRPRKRLVGYRALRSASSASSDTKP